MAQFAIYEFESVVSGAEVLEPPYLVNKFWEVGQVYSTSNKTVAVQIQAASPIRVTTDGTPAIAGVDRLINTGELATIIFKNAGQWLINSVVA